MFKVNRLAERLSIKFKFITAFISLVILTVIFILFFFLSITRIADSAKLSFSAYKTLQFLGDSRTGVEAIAKEVALLNFIAISGEGTIDTESLELEIESADEGILGAAGESYLYPEHEELFVKLEDHWNDAFVPAVDGYLELVGSGTKDPKALQESFQKVTDARVEIQQYIYDINIELSKIFQNGFDLSILAKEWGTIIAATVLALSLLITVMSVALILSITKKLTQIANRISESSSVAHEATEKLQGESIQLSSSATQQASSIQETVATLTQINAMMKKSLEFVHKTQEKAGQSQSASHNGLNEIKALNQAINSISEAQHELMEEITKGNENFSQLIKVINEMGAKTSVINDIVFQTKLLSFNASVEAARAGEHGKGFAVVAEEVGNLAQLSGNASKEISEMVSQSSQQVEQIVASTSSKIANVVEQSTQEINLGIEIANKCDHIFNELVNDFNSVKDMMGEITTTSQEQVEGVDNINIAMDEIDRTTHANSNSSAKISHSASNLKNKAESLKKITLTLEELINGKTSESPRQNVPVEQEDEQTTEQPQSPEAAA